MRRFKKGDVIVPGDKLKPSLWRHWALDVESVDSDGTIHAAPSGGGFVKIFSPERVLFHGFVVVPKKMMDEQVFYQARFTMDAFEEEGVHEVFMAWTDGSSWNGWGVPLFEFDEAMRLIEVERGLPGVKSAYYDEARRAFIVEFTNSDFGEEVFGEERIVVDGREISVWGIGAMSWTWDYPKA